jgi:hypothetical protein
MHPRHVEGEEKGQEEEEEQEEDEEEEEEQEEENEGEWMARIVEDTEDEEKSEDEETDRSPSAEIRKIVGESVEIEGVDPGDDSAAAAKADVGPCIDTQASGSTQPESPPLIARRPSLDHLGPNGSPRAKGSPKAARPPPPPRPDAFTWLGTAEEKEVAQLAAAWLENGAASSTTAGRRSSWMHAAIPADTADKTADENGAPSPAAANPAIGFDGIGWDGRESPMARARAGSEVEAAEAAAAASEASTPRRRSSFDWMRRRSRSSTDW